MRRQSKHDRLLPKAQALYEKGLSQRQVAERLGVKQQVIQYLFRRHGVAGRSLADAQVLRWQSNPPTVLRGREHPNYRTGRWTSRSIYRRLLKRDKCSRCGRTDGQIDGHHINSDHFDNRLENLVVLCMPCHRSQHMLEYWQDVKAGRRVRTWRPGK
jgi:5-methylcytosine-specific restriction endonuclease McrA